MVMCADIIHSVIEELSEKIELQQEYFHVDVLVFFFRNVVWVYDMYVYKCFVNLTWPFDVVFNNGFPWLHQNAGTKLTESSLVNKSCIITGC